MYEATLIAFKSNELLSWLGIDVLTGELQLPISLSVSQTSILPTVPVATITIGNPAQITVHSRGLMLVIPDQTTSISQDSPFQEASFRSFPSR
jgi:hypothetical protein